MFESHDAYDSLSSSLAAALRRDVRPAGGRDAAIDAIMARVQVAPAPRREAHGRSRLLTLRPMRPRWALRRGILSPAAGVLAACLTIAIGWLGALGGQRQVPASSIPGTVAQRSVALTGASTLRDSLLDNALVVAIRDTLRVVRFALEAPAAARVAVVGDFTGWGAEALPLRRVAGAWTAEVALRRGRHRFGFVIDDTGWVGGGRGVDATAVAIDTTTLGSTRFQADTL
jgi:Glycogen recognition site of AMP-activated protein kinase